MLEIVGNDLDDHPSTESVDELLVRVASGDRDAFADLYDRVAARVLGLVRRVLIDHAQSEEVTQEIFLEIWTSAPRFEPDRGSGITWILTMTHRRAIDRVRSSQSSIDRDERIGRRDIEVDFDDVSEKAEIRIEHERVKRAMAALPDAQREAIALAYYGGFSQSEVADILSVPLGTVKTRMRQAMIRLREELGVSA